MQTESTPPSPPPIQVAIIGAGIGGLGLAIGLLRHAPHISFTVYEAADGFSAVGAGIAFAPNALLAMSMLSPAFRTAYEAIATSNWDPAKQHVLFDMALAEPGFGASRGVAPQSIAYDYFRKSSAHRAELLHIMKALVPTDRVRFSKRATKIWQAGAKVRVFFADGDGVEVDAVVGCDGGKGTTRSAVLGERYPATVAATYSGRYVYRAVVPIDRAREALGDYAEDGKMLLGPGTYVTSYQMSGGTKLNLLAGRQKDEPWTHSRWTQETTREEMLKDFEGRLDSRLVKLVYEVANHARIVEPPYGACSHPQIITTTLTPAQYALPLKWSLHHHVDTPTYISSQICLLGDSAHTTTPHQGSGASLALEDAVTLSSLLALCTASRTAPALQLRVAFQVYDQLRRPRGQAVVRTSDEAGRMYCMAATDTTADVSLLFAAVVRSARQRFHWIWTFDLRAEVCRASTEFIRCMEAVGEKTADV